MTAASSYSYDDFITDLGLITSVETNDQEKIKKIARKMKLLLGSGGDLMARLEKTPQAGHYARHLLFQDPKRRFIVVGMVWGPGQGTPIHDHSTWGVAGVVTNELRIVNYVRMDDGTRPDYADLREAMAIGAPAGTVTYMLPPNEEIHLLENIGDKPTLSLHVYGKEITQCNTFDPKTKAIKVWKLSYDDAPSARGAAAGRPQ